MRLFRKLKKSWKFVKGELQLSDRCRNKAHGTGNSRMQMSTRHSGRTSSMSTPNHINAMDVIDTSPQSTPSNSRPMHVPSYLTPAILS